MLKNLIALFIGLCVFIVAFMHMMTYILDTALCIAF